ncbi:unnamed protein product [Adineta steineri]|uniref:Fibronectin type-II domain-containing protein n=2 Tax=Adineta steineri TaxID=433720 RepID=A0A815LNU4_9BILA|nr:unnamed protein product [Adineta steineri]CAF3689298.1 unnamed protein product [Adineta steineri]
MACRLIVSFLIVLACASIYADNDWKKFPDSDKYGIDKSQCVFPFTYRDKKYHDCTTDGDNGDWPWCSKDDAYIGHFHYCHDFRNSTIKCKKEYAINGKTFNGCAKWTTNAAYKRCKTDDDTYPIINCPPALDKPKSNYTRGRLPKCDPAYTALSPNHTMCYAPSDYGVEVPIDEDEKQAILDIHNGYRAEVDADHMFVLHWDDELAKIALGRSRLCGFDHDLASNRKSTVYKTLNGQNLVLTTDPYCYGPDLIDQMLGSEKPNFEYGVGCKGAGNCLHYTQAMISNLTRVGCARVQCVYPTRTECFLTCNYIESQYATKYMRPYETKLGAAKRCPHKKDDTGKLCECGPKICDQNTEYLHPDFCECHKTSTGRNKRDDEVESTIESGKSIVALSGIDMSTLLKRKRRSLINVRHGQTKTNK